MIGMRFRVTCWYVMAEQALCHCLAVIAGYVFGWKAGPTGWLGHMPGGNSIRGDCLHPPHDSSGAGGAKNHSQRDLEERE